MHLSIDDYLRASAGDASPTVRVHLDTCGECRALVESLVRTEREARETGVPEPSPLFWAHLSERIRRAVDASPPSSRWAWLKSSRVAWPGWRLAWQTGASVAVTLAAVTIWTVAGSRPATETAARPPSVASPQDALGVPMLAEQVDPEWQLMMDMTSETDVDSLTLGLGVGTADQAFDSLSEEDRMSLSEWLALELEPAQGGRS